MLNTNKINGTPLVSVVMPVYNGEKYVAEAIDSVLKQTYANLELIVINDSSTDGSVKIINGYKKLDPRIVLIDNTFENRGLVGALNLGLSAAQGDFIARMDCDDICLANRFSRQLTFLHQHPEVDLCGSWVKPFGKISQLVWQYPVEHIDIALRLLFNSAFAHPAVMFRRNLLSSGYQYDKQFRHAEDYELFTRLCDQSTFANVPEVLLMYRTHNENVGTIHSAAQQESARKVQFRELVKKGIHPSDREMEIHRSLEVGGYPKTQEFLSECEIWLNKIKNKLLEQSTADATLIKDRKSTRLNSSHRL